ncbi:MAG TPA: AAA family ATPase [Flavobacteriales bacterium]|nr:AAA family ATPase [Flavobacteriales bacterium]
MQIEEIIEELVGQMEHAPNDDQQALFRSLGNYLLSRAQQKIFLLKGYAGTGKTTVLSALQRFLNKCNYDVVLLAPTGRAAKVITGYSGQPAYTIHKKIYSAEDAETGAGSFSLGHNAHKNTFFIVDEAGMVGNEAGMYTGNGRARHLLDDLIEYVFNGQNCQLILSGDTAQLPPVGSPKSPALDGEFLVRSYNAEVHTYELWNVVRQKELSGILENATQLREMLRMENPGIPELNFNGTDFKNITGYDFPEELENAYSKYGYENVLIITRSNKKANAYNNQIRNRLLYRENAIDAGDQVMIIRNNYFWNKQFKGMPFIANGDNMEILRVGKTVEKHGFTFAEAEAVITGQQESYQSEFMFLLDTIPIETASLSAEKTKELYQSVLQEKITDGLDHPKFKVLSDPFFNALHIKFSYAVTCHKAQGGQWPVVFIDAGVPLPDMDMTEYVRWMYTAVTRGVEKVFFVGYKNSDNSNA